MPDLFGDVLRLVQEAAEPQPGHNYLANLRPNQIPPDGDWLICLAMAGRGWGKSHAGARWLLQQASTTKGYYAVVAPTFTDVRAVCVEGESGLIAALEAAGEPYEYHKTKNEITLRNGSVIYMLSADRPDRIRGYNLAGAWCDEMGSWRYESAWYDGLTFALRKGDYPRVFVTTTPRSTKLMRDLAGTTDGTLVMLRGSTWENKANLSAAQLKRYEAIEGTTRGRQELHGELLEDMPGANWRRPWIDGHRIQPVLDEDTGEVLNLPAFQRVIIGVDPSGTATKNSDECGIVVAGMAQDGQVYVLADESLVASPDGWARVVARAYDKWSADRVVAEKNFGGDMVASTLRHVRDSLPIRMVTASRGKAVRAEPIAALYEQGRVHHVGAFPDLEDQMTQWEPSNPDSPDRMDALVWALTELTKGDQGQAFLTAWKRQQQPAQPAEAAEAAQPVPAPSLPSWRDRAAAQSAQRFDPPKTRPPVHA